MHLREAAPDEAGWAQLDGVYGAGTRSRVRAFQQDAGIGVDGKVGPQTWRKLRTYGKALAWVRDISRSALPACV